jgi:1-phosphofructokinase
MPAHKVITVTLNPSLDRTLVTHYLALGYPNRTVDNTRLDPAGRGVNVARALHALKTPTHSIILLGSDGTGHAYQALVKQEGFPATFVRREGLTRSNVFIVDTGNNTETQLIEESVGVSEQSIKRVTKAMRAAIDAGDTVLLAGSLPNDAPPDIHIQLADLAHDLGAQVAVDVPGDLLATALKGKPDLAILTQREAEGLFNYPVRAREEVAHAGRRLVEQGMGAVLLLEDGPAGIVLVTTEDEWYADLPEIDPITLTGSKEATLAGFLTGRLRGQSPPEALSLGAAAAAYTLAQIGSAFGTLAEVKKFMEEADRLTQHPVA